MLNDGFVCFNMHICNPAMHFFVAFTIITDLEEPSTVGGIVTGKQFPVFSLYCINLALFLLIIIDYHNNLYGFVLLYIFLH